MNSYYVVIDTNVLISALLTKHNNSATFQIVQKITSGVIIPVYSSLIFAEYMEVFNRSKFDFKKDEIDYLLNLVKRNGQLIEPSIKGIIIPDLKDIPFYEVAFETQDQRSFLVTGNIKHFPREPFIVTPRELIDIIDSET